MFDNPDFDTFECFGIYLEHCEVIEVFTVTEHMDSVKKSSEEEINKLNALINSLDSNDKSNISTIVNNLTLES